MLLVDGVGWIHSRLATPDVQNGLLFRNGLADQSFARLKGTIDDRAPIPVQDFHRLVVRFIELRLT
jgi:hypothetical protein